MGSRLENETKEGLQTWSSDLGIGQPTGVDLPGEAAGLLPTPEWRNDLYKQELTDRPWSVGDNINLAIGQGDLQADPLQMAVAYAAIANGGTIVRPHLAESVEDARGVTVSEFDPAPRRKLDIPADARQAVLAGMHDAATAAGGTSVEVFGDFPIAVAGKTGTAQRPPNGLQSWYASVAPYEDPKYVVVTTVENGGYGAETAAPVAKAIYQALFAKELKGTETGLEDPFSQPLEDAEAPITATAAG
jgi:penicillin-binding protein 2